MWLSSVSLPQVDPEADRWVTISKGLLVFITFLKGATAEVFPKLGE